MRAVEVSFIRACAEMAARSSLTRTESRWGLYHERSDVPARDDSPDAPLRRFKWKLHCATQWAPSESAAREALGLALADADADVRAYARRALNLVNV